MIWVLYGIFRAYLNKLLWATFIDLIVFLFKLKIPIPYVHLGKQYVLYIKALIFGLTPGGFIPKPFKLKKHLSTENMLKMLKYTNDWIFDGYIAVKILILSLKIFTSNNNE